MTPTNPATRPASPLRNRRLRHVGAIGLAVVAALTLTAPAFGAPPEFSTQVIPQSYSLECDGFDALVNLTITQREKLTVDQAGTPVLLTGKITIEGTLTNSVTGFTIQDPAHYTFRLELDTGRLAVNGLVLRRIAPGRGVVAHDAGLLIVEPDGTVVARGPKDFLNLGDQATVCDALG